MKRTHKGGQFKKGRILPKKFEELRLKRLREKLVGKKRLPYSLEWRRKIGEASKGRIPWNKGKPQTPEVREKLRQAQLKNPTKYWKGKKRPEFSAEWKKHMARVPWNKGKKWIEFSGPNHPRWKGMASISEWVRRCFEYRQWRSDVYTRDNFTCQNCGEVGGHLHAHHIDRFSDIMTRNNIKTQEQAMECQELWNINNGITLCEKCHGKIKNR